MCTILPATIPTIIYYVYMHIATILHPTYRTGTGTVNGPGVLQSGRSVAEAVGVTLQWIAYSLTSFVRCRNKVQVF